MQDAQKPDHISLNNLVQRLKEGRFVVPNFQREFEWQPWDIRELTRSIFLDYYIGSLLLWRGSKENYRSLSCEPLFGGVDGSNAEYIVLDGQQRLTAMNYAFIAPQRNLPNRKMRALYYVRVDRFMAGEHEEAFDYDWDWSGTARLLADTEAQFKNHIFPLATIGTGGWSLGNWVQGYERYWRDSAVGGQADATLHIENARAFGDSLRSITDRFQISYVELDRELELEKVCEIFTQLNSRGVRLDVFDLMNALLAPKGLELKQLWRSARKRLEFVDTAKMNVYALQVMSILRQSYCSSKFLYFLLPGKERQVREPDGSLSRQVLISDVGEFRQRWEEAISALELAIRLLRHPQEFGVTSADYLPYVSILPVFAALATVVSRRPASDRLNASRKFRFWYWASVFTNRYSGSVESTSARDFQDVQNWLSDDTAEPASIGEFRARLPTLDLRSETKKGSATYNAVFNLLVIEGARDWISGNVPQPDELDDHHIVPAWWGRKNVQGQLANSILNRSPLSASTNRHVIGERLPNQYLPELIARSSREHVEALMASHFISPTALDILLRDPFTYQDFESFLVERHRTILEAIGSLLVHERLDLSPDVRKLDERLEQVELGLRSVLVAIAGGSTEALPQHIAVKIEERIKTELRKNPAMDTDRLKTLAGMLEHADLRELEHALLSDVLWGRVQGRFGTKPGLSTRFAQLAGLRNCIRHSRRVDEITRKDGEAAILWFEQTIGKPTSAADNLAY